MRSFNFNDEDDNTLSPQEELDLLRSQLKHTDPNAHQTVADIREKITDLEFHILKYGNYWL